MIISAIKTGLIRADIKITSLILLGFGGGVILTALASEYIGGLVPCDLCYQQRWPYYIGLGLIGIAFLTTHFPHIVQTQKFHSLHLASILIGLAGLVFSYGAGLGFYHAGIEYGLWEAPFACRLGETLSDTAQGEIYENISDFLDALDRAKIISCDKVAWQFLGISMAGYNFIASTLIAGLSLRLSAIRLFFAKGQMRI